MKSTFAALVMLAPGISWATSALDIDTPGLANNGAGMAGGAYLAAKQSDSGAQDNTAEQWGPGASDELDAARIATLAEISGLAPADIVQRRAAGSSWTDIARALGVDPSVIGIGSIDDRPPPFAADPGR